VEGVSHDRPTSYAELAAIIDNLPLLIREKRRARGLSLRAAAKEVGCSFSTLSRAENDGDLRGNNLGAVLRWLDESPAR
jgi:ribosome-binding protein aMBF1 (putative translation factor)